MQAKDIMTRDVVTAGPNASVADIAGLLVKHRVSAIPVVNAENEVIGIVSEGDLMRRSEIHTEQRHSWWLVAMTSSAELAEEFTKAHGVKASEVMTTDVTTVTEDASVGWVAEVLESKKIKRVPVVRDGKLVGIISRANLIQSLAVLKEKVIGLPSSDDALIRDALMEVLRREPWISNAQLNVVVTDGIVHIWGFVDSTAQQKALVVAAENVPGVMGVEDHTAFRPLTYAAE